MALPCAGQPVMRTKTLVGPIVVVVVSGGRVGPFAPFARATLEPSLIFWLASAQGPRPWEVWRPARIGQRTGVGELALTFDDGPDPVWTPAILDALRKAGAQATFFVLAVPARRHSALVRRIADEGHGVGAHAARHVRHTDLSADEGEADLDEALRAIADAGVTRPGLWRTPWGVEAEWTRPLAERRGLKVVGWSADTHDWRGDAAGEMLAAVAPGLADGTVVLAHDGLGPGALRDGCAGTVALIAPLVAAGRERGLEPRALT